MKFHVQAIPPYKQAPADKLEKQHQLERAEALKAVATTVFHSYGKLEGKIAVSIHYKRYLGRSDAANIVGGISDTLQGICYINDSQIVEITYKEEKGKQDEYWVGVEER